MWSNSHLYVNYKSVPRKKVVYFGTRGEPKDHNFYGNVSFNITMRNFMKFIEDLSLNIYFVEIVDFKTSSASKFLFTHKKYKTLLQYDPKKKGGAWYENKEEHYFLTSLKRWKPSEDCFYQEHFLEIMIELEEADYHKLFKLCESEAVEHEEAHDTQRIKRCRKTIGSSSKCPSNWSKNNTEEQMQMYDQEHTKRSLDKIKLSGGADSEGDSNHKEPGEEFGYGTLLCDPIETRNGAYYVWKPTNIYNLSSNNFQLYNLPEYKEFDSLSHVQHFEDYTKNKENESFYPNEITMWSNSHLYENYKSDPRQKVVYFGTKEDPTDHNLYGNVSFNITMKSFMKCMQNLSLNLYFVEIIDYKWSSVSKFIYTHKKYEMLTPYDPTKKGGPWYKNEEEHYFLNYLKRWEHSHNGIRHTMEILLELEDADYHTLFKLCDTEAVEHEHGLCVQTIGSSSPCPSKWSKSYTEEQMKVHDQKPATQITNKRSLDEDSDSDVSDSDFTGKYKLSKQTQ